MNGIKTLDEIIVIRKQLQDQNKKVVFTNGCFDIIHAGHIDYLSKAKTLGDVMIVGLNSDDSVQIIKGKKRPILKESERAFILTNIEHVDYVVIFDQDTPEQLIAKLIPDILVKGADWNIEDIVGKDIVLANGGEVKTITFVNEQSTSKIIDIILERYKD
ncbi:MAG: D-glycero-beta-D-manno-heptose 1-phosphate adenylyltransferase [Bacteroidetes bacterium]|nr:D-glycero-beta-D-manno-heptose 1-phosphate adenylyltransferase [Bacteroidota bacterium]MCH7769646.1 D-glycero-beta-D-manno-heptose 1-phosphate adenylyltransferase [Bacteroidota bacterium]